MESFRFVHAADLHLDTPFLGLSRVDDYPEIAGLVRRSTFDAFESVLKLCLDEKVDFLVIAGDVFDGADRSLRPMLTFRDGLARLAEAGIPTYVCHGNHDPLDGWSPSVRHHEAVTVFGEELKVVEHRRNDRPIARLAGISYGSRVENANPTVALSKLSMSDLYTIAVIHSSVGDQPGHSPYAPCSIDELRRAPLNYTALGHIHRHGILHRDPHIVYSGNTQGRSVRETGPRGCYLVEVDDSGATSANFHETDQIRWQVASIKVEGVESLDAIRDLISQQIDQLLEGVGGRSLVVRLTLTGRTPIDAELRRTVEHEELLKAIQDVYAAARPFALIESLRVETHPDVNLTDRAEGEDLLAMAIQIAGETETSEKLKESARNALSELYDHSEARRLLDQLDEATLIELIREARYLVYDRLEGSE